MFYIWLENEVYYFIIRFIFSLCLLLPCLGNSFRQLSASLISSFVLNYSSMIMLNNYKSVTRFQKVVICICSLFLNTTLHSPHYHRVYFSREIMTDRAFRLKDLHPQVGGHFIYWKLSPLPFTLTNF